MRLAYQVSGSYHYVVAPRVVRSPRGATMVATRRGERRYVREMANEGKPLAGSDAGAEDEGLVVESLGGANGDGGRRGRGATRRVGGEAARALWGRRLSGRARLARGALIVALVGATLFALLGGPALAVAGWQRLTFALRSGTFAPRLAMTDWQPLPAPHGVASATLTYTPDPVAPATVFACEAGAGGVGFWRTETRGDHWTHALISQTPADSCQVKVALDSSLRLLLVTRTADPLRPGCQRIALYFSALSGLSWTPMSLSPASLGAACEADAWASANWVFMWWATNADQSAPATRLMRSGDLGATWQNADGGLPARDAYLAPALTRYGAGSALLAEVYYWPRHGRLNILRQVVHSLDDGATWETLSGGPLGLGLLASPEPREAGAGAWRTIYAPVYTDAQLSPLWTPDQPPEGIQTLSVGSGVWRDLPPLPVNGAAAVDHLLGVAAPLGVAPADILLTLGADPHTSVTDHQRADDLWLWAWDPTASEWRLGQQAPPNARLVGFSWSAGPVGGPFAESYGAYLWLSGATGGNVTLYSAFIPAAQGG